MCYSNKLADLLGVFFFFFCSSALLLKYTRRESQMEMKNK